MNKCILGSMMGLLLVLSPVTHAGEAGWYGGLSISNAFEDFDSEYLDGVDIDDSIVLGAQLGYRFSKESSSFQPALEFKFRIFDEFEGRAFGFEGDVEAWAISIRPKLYFGDGIAHPYVFVGIGVMDGELSIPALFISESESDIMLEFGAGAEFDINERFGLFIEADYILPQGDLEDFSAWEIGVGFNIRF